MDLSALGMAAGELRVYTAGLETRAYHRQAR